MNIPDYWERKKDREKGDVKRYYENIELDETIIIETKVDGCIRILHRGYGMDSSVDHLGVKHNMRDAIVEAKKMMKKRNKEVMPEVTDEFTGFM